MLMSPNKGETAVHGYQCLGDVALRMREVLARPRVSLCMPLVLSLPSYNVSINLRTHANFWLSLCLSKSRKSHWRRSDSKRYVCVRMLCKHRQQASLLRSGIGEKRPMTPKSFEAGSCHFQTELLDG